MNKRRSAAILWLLLAALPEFNAEIAYGQFPGGGSPGGYGPSPGGGGVSPGGYRPSQQPNGVVPGRPSPYGQPPRYGQPSTTQPGNSPYGNSPYSNSPYNPSPYGNPVPGTSPQRTGTYYPGQMQTSPSQSYWPGRPQPGVPQHLGSPQATFNRHTDPHAIRYSTSNIGVKPLGSPAWQRMGSQFATGQIDNAKAQVNAYLQQNNSLNSWMSVVASLEQSGAPHHVVHDYRNQAIQLAQGQISRNVSSPTPWMAMAQFSLQAGQTDQFRAATQEFVQRYPDNQHANYFSGIRAIQDEDWKSAEAALKKAKSLGMSDESINQLLKMVIDKQRWVWQFAQITGIVVVAWLVGLLMLYFAGNILSFAALRKIKKHGAKAALNCGVMLRWCYRTLINMAGMYYILSLPILVLIALALPLSIVYALLSLPSISIVLIVVVLLLGFGGLLTALSGLRALFVRLPREAPGRNVTAEDAPELWRLVREVAERVGARPVDQIRITSGADMFVLELGSYSARMHDRGQRVLAIGMRLIDRMDETALRSILAHEYGHFLHRDTAGGDVAMRIYGAMDGFVLAILKRGPVRWWDVSVQFLRFFHALFRRLTFGASRLQEIRADYVAVTNYGPAALKAGLLHAIRQGLEFDLDADQYLKKYVRSQITTCNFYVSPQEKRIEDWEQIEVAVARAFKMESSSEDTHPSPSERIKFAEQLGIADPDLPAVPLQELLPNRAQLQTEFNQEIHDALSFEAANIRDVSKHAVQQLSEYLRNHQDDRGYLERALFYLNLGEFDLALHDLAQVSGQSVIGDEAAFGTATVLYLMEDYPRAVEAYTKIMYENPGTRTLDNYLCLGQACVNSGLHGQAIEAFTKALSEDVCSLWGLVGRGRAYAAMARTKEALCDLSKALDHFPDCIELELEIEQLKNATTPVPSKANEVESHPSESVGRRV